MTTDDSPAYLWANIGPDAWLLVDGPSTPTSGVIRAYLIGIEPDDWLWRGVGGEGRSDSMDRAMLEAQLSVVLAMRPDALFDSGDSDGDDDSEDGDGSDDDGSRDFIDDLLDPDT